MRAILIDSEKQSVEEIDFEGNYETINQILGSDIYEHAQENGNSSFICVDEEGLLKQPKHFFKCTLYPTPLAGRGLILSSKNDRYVGTDVDIECLNVQFASIKEVA